MTRFVVLGAGTAGTMIANRLARRLASRIAAGQDSVTVVDRDDRHLYQPGLLFVPFGELDRSQIEKPRAAQLLPGVHFVEATVDRLDAEADLVHLDAGDPLPYDVLVIASGCQLQPQETEGLTGPGWRERVFDFYSPEGASALAARLADFRSGRLVVGFVDLPIKCPVAPLEFAFLADAYFERMGRRDAVEITYLTPLDGAFTKASCSLALRHLLDEKRIHLVTDFATGRVDGAAGRIESWNGRVEPFDLLVMVPLHAGADFVPRTPGLGDELGFVITDRHTLQSAWRPNVFALGDAANLPTSKAGSVAHFEAELLERNLMRFVAGEPLVADYDGHSNCFIETGHGRALLIDFNYDIEPQPGRFPSPTLGPLPLLEESRLAHIGKLAFRWIYWNLLLPGHDLPGVTPQLRPQPPAPAAQGAGDRS